MAEIAAKAMLILETPAPDVPANTGGASADVARARQQLTLAHAARHNILRRMAPALRHDMVVHLQSVSMMSEALAARVERGAAGEEDLQAAMSKLSRLTRSAVDACAEVATWMAPAEDDAASLRAGVDEAVRLLRSSLNFRGMTIDVAMVDGSFLVDRSGIRFLLPAAILVLADSTEGPGQLVIGAETSATHAVLAVSFTPCTSESVPLETHETPLQWTEVSALAACASVELRRNGSEVLLRFPRAVPTSPLSMVPVV